VTSRPEVNGSPEENSGWERNSGPQGEWWSEGVMVVQRGPAPVFYRLMASFFHCN